MIILRLFWLCFLFSVCAQADIQKIRSFDEATASLKNASCHTMVLFDIDATITLPQSKMLWPTMIAKHSDWLKSAYDDVFQRSTQSTDVLKSIWMDQETPIVIEPKIVEMIKHLQKKDILVFALTAIQTGSHFTVASLPQWRFNKLQEIGIDFRNERVSDVTFSHLEGTPLFYRGILCSAGVSKGVALGALLDHLQFNPDAVIFFDDSLNRLEEVEKEMVKRNISFLGYHYMGAHHIVGELDKELSIYQLNYLVEHGAWIMEDEAKSLLRSD